MSAVLNVENSTVDGSKGARATARADGPVVGRARRPALNRPAGRYLPPAVMGADVTGSALSTQSILGCVD
jgi:hypothetical protein